MCAMWYSYNMYGSVHIMCYYITVKNRIFKEYLLTQGYICYIIFIETGICIFIFIISICKKIFIIYTVT